MRDGPGYIQFRDGTRQKFDQPRNTLDPRYPHCRDHHAACICREAEWSEERDEYAAEWQAVRKLIAGDILAGHSASICRCTGCQIVRALHLTHLVQRPDTEQECPF